MREEIRRVLRTMKPAIVSRLTQGMLDSLLAELANVFVQEDYQKIECDGRNHGARWATDTLVDRLKSVDDQAFWKFLKFLKNNQSTADLYAEICRECHKEGVMIAEVQEEGAGRPRKGQDKKETVKMILNELRPVLRQSLSEGQLMELLRNFEVELNGGDVQRIKQDFGNDGKNKAIDTFVSRLLNCGRRCFKRFIAYLKMNNDELYKQFEVKCQYYGVEDLLQKSGIGNHEERGPDQEGAVPRDERRPDNPPVQETNQGEASQLKTDEQKAAYPTPIQESNRGGILGKNRSEDVTEAVQETLREHIEDKEVIEEKRMPQREVRQVSGIQASAVRNDDKPPSVSMSKLTLKEDAHPKDSKLSTNKPEKQKEIEHYKMSSKPRGICLILNNQDFSKSRAPGAKGSKYDDREGSEVDEQNLREIFEWLQFHVYVYKDKTALDMWQIFLKWSAYDHGNYDCFAVCMLSHGERRVNADEVCGVDGKGIELDEIFRLFNGEKCQSLANKPKLFFLQCCRGLREDDGIIPKGVVVSDGSSAEAQHKVPVGADFFIGYATPPGQKSWRNTTEGSWYITKVCQVFKQLAKELDLMTMMTKVNSEVSKFYTEKGRKQVPNPSMTLRKLLYFFHPTSESTDDKNCQRDR